MLSFDLPTPQTRTFASEDLTDVIDTSLNGYNFTNVPATMLIGNGATASNIDPSSILIFATTVTSTQYTVNGTSFTLGSTAYSSVTPEKYRTFGSDVYKFVARGVRAGVYYYMWAKSESPPAPCFLANAPVLTPSGYQKISKLRIGDTVISGNRTVAIQKVIRTRVQSSPSTNPYRVPKGTLNATKSVLISPNHKVLVNGSMVEARYLGLEQEDQDGTIEYYNLELPSANDTFVVAGLTVESMAHIRRVTMTMDRLKAKLIAQYGSITPAVIDLVKQTCVMLPNGLVNVPTNTCDESSHPESSSSLRTGPHARA
jgi:hypothetical protein